MTSRGCASPYGILENSLAAGPAVIRQVSQGSDLVEQDEAALPGTPGPSIDTPATPPSSPMRPIIPDLKGQYQPHVSLPCPYVLSPSEGAGVDGQSARTNPARVLPSHWFFASPDQIDALGMLRTWIHSQVCYLLGCVSRSSAFPERQSDLGMQRTGVMVTLWLGWSLLTGHQHKHLQSATACVGKGGKCAVGTLHSDLE